MRPRCWRTPDMRAVRRLRRALARVMPAAGELELRWLWFAGRVACWVWDDALWDAVSGRLLERASDRRVSTS